MGIPKTIKSFLNDSTWSIAGLLLMNVVAQFGIYPVWSAKMGNEAYGNVLYLISIMNILAISTGTSVNSARMARSASRQTLNGNYGSALVVLSATVMLIGLTMYGFSVPEFNWLDTALFLILIVLTMWRYYSDVQYRLTLNYPGYFSYYLAISVGYLAGIALFLITGLWQLALIPGELAGLLYAYCYRSSIREGLFRRDKEYPEVFHLILTLTGSSIISQLIFNGDRLLLMYFAGGNAVTIYYLASLLGKTMSLITTPLNSVIIGYLARIKGNMTVRIMNIASILALAAILLGTAGCTVMSLIVIRILYPHIFSLVRPYFLVANLAQVVYFVGNVVMTLLLRFAKAKYQFTVNVLYACVFVVFCIPTTYFWGVSGFATGILMSNITKLLTGIFLGYRTAIRSRNEQG